MICSDATPEGETDLWWVHPSLVGLPTVRISIIRMATDRVEPPSDPPAAPSRRRGRVVSSDRGESENRSSAETVAIDTALMRRVATGEEAAVGELYDRFAGLVYKMATQSLSTRNEAEDAVQDVFVRIWRTADRYDAKRAALVTWVMLITRRHLVDRLRRTKSRISVSKADPESVAAAFLAQVDPSDGMRTAEDFAVLVKRIESLPELQRTVVMRAYLGGQTLRQIGDEIGAPIGTVKSALSRALVRLRERVSEAEP